MTTKTTDPESAESAESTESTERERIQTLFSGALVDAPSSSDLPDPGPIWRRAEKERRRALARRALRPVIVVERLAWMCGAVAAVIGLAVWLPGVIKPWLASVAHQAVAAIPGQGQSGDPAFAAAGLGMLALASVAFLSGWLEEA